MRKKSASTKPVSPEGAHAPGWIAEQRLRACIENTPNVAVQWYDEEGRVLFWNRASEQVFGWTSAEALGKTLDQLTLTPKEAEAFAARLRRIQREGETTSPQEVAVLVPAPGAGGRSAHRHGHD